MQPELNIHIYRAISRVLCYSYRGIFRFLEVNTIQKVVLKIPHSATLPVGPVRIPTDTPAVISSVVTFFSIIKYFI